MSHSFPLQPGTVLCDRYVLREVVHSGHWSLTLRAQRQVDGETVILKLPGPGNTASGVSIAFHAAWMQRVFHSLSQLHHPNRASVLDYIESHGLPVLVQQEVLGIPMSQRMVHRPLDEAEAIQLIRKVAIALSGVHGKGLIHRDVRPENIIYRSGVQQPVLIDWGLQPSVFPANRASSYAAPEQFQPGGQFQPSIDVYGLAATLYAWVTGQPPLHASLRQQSTLELPRRLRPNLSAAIERAILSGMELNPQARPPSVGAWMGLLPEEAPVRVETASPASSRSREPIPVPIVVGSSVPSQGAGVEAAPVARSASASSSSATSPQTKMPATQVVDRVPSSTQTIDLEAVQPPSTPFKPMRNLIMLGFAATLFGLSMGLVLRVTNPASVAGISALGRPQSFPEGDWPGSDGLIDEVPYEVPPPEQGFSTWDEDDTASSPEPFEELPAESLREVVVPVDDEPPISKPLSYPDWEEPPSGQGAGDRFESVEEGDRSNLNSTPDREYNEPPRTGFDAEEPFYDEAPAAGTIRDDDEFIDEGPFNPEPIYEEPVYEEPAYEEPAYEEPFIPEPIYEEPAYEEPVYDDAPLYEEPAYEEPVYDDAPLYEAPVPPPPPPIYNQAPIDEPLQESDA